MLTYDQHLEHQDFLSSYMSVKVTCDQSGEEYNEHECKCLTDNNGDEWTVSIENVEEFIAEMIQHNADENEQWFVVKSQTL